MNARSFLCLALASHAQLVVAAGSAQAQATKNFVASFGADTNDGSRGSPKRNFQAAHDTVAAGGEIVALDTAGYGVVSITKAIGITAPPGITGFITTSSGTPAVTVNAPSGTVTLRGLTLNTTSGTPIGIDVNNVGALTVTDCTISGFRNAGIEFGPASTATLLVKNSTVRDSFNGILTPTNGPANATVVIDGCRLESNTAAGLSISSPAAGVSNRFQVHDSLFAGNGTAIADFGANNRVAMSGCTFSANSFGIRVFTSGATANVDGCTISGNTTGLNNNPGANLLSRSNNTVENNGTDGTFTATYSAK